LFELNTPAAADRFRSYCEEFNLLTASLGRSARVKAKAYHLVFRFVPCQSSFDPSDLDHISAIETENSLEPGSISSASWLKNPERRSPNQHVASLKVTCSSPEAANHLLRERVYIAGHVVNIRKDLREPIRCNKCQLYGHIRSACISDEKCAYCASSDHTTAECRPDQRPVASPVAPTPTTQAPLAPARPFKEKCTALDARYPENTMPYFPTGERWTWARAPPKLSTSPPQLQPLQQPNPSPSPSSTPNRSSFRNRNLKLNAPKTPAGNKSPLVIVKLPSRRPPRQPNSSQNRSQTTRTPPSSQ
jgi:hypothetical protein